ncbi:MAG: monofunctional biosynthetic peptidoglycan transglycosylase [Woeseia sp.]
MLLRLGRLFAVTILSLFLLSLLAVVPLRWLNPPITAFMLADKNSRGILSQGWVRWAEVGESMPLAVIASEDQKFAAHRGFDVDSIRKSIVQYADGAPLRGASTISQQVAKNLYLWRGRSFVRKGFEAYFTLLIEASWSKRRILEVYLNIAEFGPGIYGAGTAATTFFGKPPAAMSDREAALLAAVLPNPVRLHADRPSEYVRKRQGWIAGQMQRLRREQWLLLIADD